MFFIGDIDSNDLISEIWGQFQQFSFVNEVFLYLFVSDDVIIENC